MAQVARTRSGEAMQSLIDHHPLQRLQAPSRSISLLVHALGVCSMTYSYAYLVLYPNPISESYGWHFQYLTIIGLTLTTLTLALGLLSDLTLSTQLFTLKNHLSTTATPMSLLITLLYFSLRLIDPALVIPAHLALPLPTDLSFHLSPTLFLLIDILFLSPPWTITVIPACVVSGVIAAAYWVWVEHCYVRNGFWPYPIFDLVGHQGRLGLFVGSAVCMVMVTVVLKTVQGRVLGVGAPGGGRRRRRSGVGVGKVNGKAM